MSHEECVLIIMKNEVLHNFWGLWDAPVFHYAIVCLWGGEVMQPGGTLGMKRQSQAGEHSGLVFACCVTPGKLPRCPVYPGRLTCKGFLERGEQGLCRYLSPDR